MKVSSGNYRPPSFETDDQGEAYPPLDLVHLSRQTMGDGELEAEILALFRSQCEIYSQSLANDNDTLQLMEIAHQMKGCAKSVGAWTIAKKAEILEDEPTKPQHIVHLREQIHLVEKYLKSMG